MKRQRASRLAGLVGVAIAAAALIGWWAGLPVLASWGVGDAMRPPVAVGLVGLGLAVAYPGRDRRFASATGLAVMALAVLGLALALALALSADEPGLDRWLARPASMALQIPKAVLVALALTGGALALSRFERHCLVAAGLAGLSGAIAVLSLLGYLTGLDNQYGVPSVLQPPLSTTSGVLCVVCGLLLQIGKMPALHAPRPLWQLLAALGCATTAPLLLFGAYAGSRMADAQLDQVRNDLTIVARTVSAEIDRQIVAEMEKLQALAVSQSLREGDFAAFQRQAEAELALSHSGDIILVDRSMEQLVNTRLPYGTPMPKAVAQGPAERALSTGKVQFTGLFAGPVTGELRFAIIVPVVIDGDNRYALVRSPDRAAFARLVAARDLPSGWQAVVTDAAHHVLAESGRENGEIGTTLPRAQWHAGPGGIFEFTDDDGRAFLEAYADSDLTGWATAVLEPEALLEAPVRALWQALGWLALLAFALVVALALWLGSVIAGSVGHASSAAAALGAGDPLPPGGTPVAEVNMLMAQLHEAAAHREAVEQLLRQSEDTFRAMFDNSSVAKIEVVPGQGRFLRVNPAMCRFVGYSEAELLDMTVWEITHPDERARDREAIKRLLAGELTDFDVEKRYIRNDGTPVWAHTTVNLVRDEHGYPLRDFAVIQDINARKRAEHALQASKSRLELALDAARLGSWQFDAARRCFTGDARAKEIFELDPARDEVPLDEILTRVHPDEIPRVLKAIAEALDPVDPKRAVNQFRLVGPRGEIRWVETLGQGYFEGEGQGRRGVSIFGTCQDISERKESEEKEHLLMREINHRAKNMLSVVQAIANQTAARNPRDFVARFSERIQALSANQDLLVRNQWNGVEVDDLVRAQLAHFAGLIGTRIAVRGPRLRLRAASGQAIGLALHELATNAGKYGALSTDLGHVDVAWATDRGTGGDIFTMTWTETNGPPVSAPTRRGFGTIVIDAMAESSVAGTVDLDYAPSGVRWRLTCPAANALEARERDSGSGEGGRDSNRQGDGGPGATIGRGAAGPT